MSKKASKKALNCKVVKGVLTIEIGISTLAIAAQRHEGFWHSLTEKYGLVVSNELQWARDVRVELMQEGDDGSTPLHLLLDKAFEEAANNGSEGLDHDAMDALAEAEHRAAVGESVDP